MADSAPVERRALASQRERPDPVGPHRMAPLSMERINMNDIDQNDPKLDANGGGIVPDTPSNDDVIARVTALLSPRRWTRQQWMPRSRRWQNHR